MPEPPVTDRPGGLGVPVAAAGHQADRAGARRRRDAVRGADREPLPAGVRLGGRSGVGDSAVLDVPAGRIAVTTDSYVVQPLFFPGGNIGDLAVNGTINDLACSGAQPLGLTAGFILEEGLELEVLGAVAQTMGKAAGERGRRASSPATPRSSDRAVRTGSSSTPPVSAWCPAGVRHRARTRTPGRPRHRVGQPRRTRRGDHERARGHRLRHRRHHRQRAAAPAGGRRCWPPSPGPGRGARAARPDARRAGRFGRRDRARRSGRRRTRRGDDPGARDRVRRPARSWAWTRCRWPTRASWWRSSTPRTVKRCWTRCGRDRKARAPSSSGASSTSIPGWPSARPRSAPPA